MPEKDIITELLSIEQFALSIEASAALLRQKATRLRTRLEKVSSPAGLDSELIAKSNAALSGRMQALKRKQQKAA